MYSLILTAALSISAGLGMQPLTNAEPIPANFNHEGIEVLSLVCEKLGSDVSITLMLQIEDTVLSINSTSYNYVEASEKLKEVIEDIANK
jgi:hypothetical protein